MPRQPVPRELLVQPARLDGPVALTDYSAQWPKLYLQQTKCIRAALGDRVVLLEHVGSTSVPGLAAKPIIDICLTVPDSADEPAYVPALQAAGYMLHAREPDWQEHRLLRGANPEVNLHVFTTGSPEVERLLRFRDRLRADDQERRLYESTKRQLARQRWQYVQEYADAKSPVIEAVIIRARGRQPRHS